MAFHFAKPAGFRFKPGQAIDVVLLDPGPPAMVEAMQLTLNDDGVDDDDIRSEEFYGY